MNKRLKEIYIITAISTIYIIVCLFFINKFALTDFFYETKYVSSALESHGLQSFLPVLNGEISIIAFPFYYFILKLSAFACGGFSEFSARIPSVFIIVFTALLSWFLIKNIVNKNFATIAVFTLMSTILLIIYSVVSSPNMIASCFVFLSVLFGVITIFSKQEKYIPLEFFCFWLFLTLAVYTNGFKSIFIPILSVIPILFADKKIKYFLRLKNFLFGFIFFISLIFIYCFMLYKINPVSWLTLVKQSLVPVICQINFFNHIPYFIKYTFIALFIGLFPWALLFFTMIVSLLQKLISYISKYKFKISDIELDESRKFFIVNLWSFFCSVIYFVIFSINDFTGLIPAIFFASISVSYYWYKNIFHDAHKKAIYISSIALYFLLLLISFLMIIAYFIVNPSQKIYIEIFIMPITLISIITAIPGIISILLKRKILNYIFHVLLSILLFLFLTTFLFNYLNSIKENDLIDFAIKAKKDKAKLVTYKIKNKYSMTYYYGSPVIFNYDISEDEIYTKYGNSRKIYMVLKLTDLAYIDKFFVYEIVQTGKHYCQITNIKYLPVDEIEKDI